MFLKPYAFEAQFFSKMSKNDQVLARARQSALKRDILEQPPFTNKNG